MRTRTLKKLLTLIATLLLTGALAIVAIGLAVPIDAPVIQERSGKKPAPETTAPDITKVPDLASLQQLANKDLRQQLFDAPPEPEPKEYIKPVPTVRLLGTIVNTKNSQAMVLGSSGTAELKRVGDMVGETDNPAVIQIIYSDHITIEHAGKPHDIAIVAVKRKSR